MAEKTESKVTKRNKRGPRKWLKVLVLSGLLLVVIALVGFLWVRHEVLGSLPRLEGKVAMPGLSQPVTIDRDALGVPTITVANRQDAAQAIGFLHGQERFFKMDLMRRLAAGELSEWFGARVLETDKTMRRHRLRNVAERVLEELPPPQLAILKSYALGVNQGLGDLKSVPFEYLLLRADAKPWEPSDSVLVVFAMALDLNDENGEKEISLGIMRDSLTPELFQFLAPKGTAWDAPMEGGPFDIMAIPGPDGLNLFGKKTMPEGSFFEPFSQHAGQSALVGSNSWAVSGHLTQRNAGLVANDMHLQLSLPHVWYRATLILPHPHNSGETIRITGVSLAGAPGILVGSNGHLAWGFTNSYIDNVDVVLVEPDPGDASRYRVPDGSEPFEHHPETIIVKGEEAVLFEVETTRWGPVVREMEDGRRQAVLWSCVLSGGINFNILNLQFCKTVSESFAVAHESGMPPQNLVAVDRQGNIGWTIAGKVPRRVGFDGRLPASRHEGNRYWDGWLPENQVPQIYNPSEGRLWTANARIVGGDKLKKLGFGGYALGARAKQIRDRLFEKESFSEYDFLAIQLDDEAKFLKPWQAYLSALLERHPSEDKPLRLQLQEEIAQWGARAAVESVGYRMVRAFRLYLMRSVYEAFTAACLEQDPDFDVFKITQWEGALWRLLQEKPKHFLPPQYETWDQWCMAVVDQMLEIFTENGDSLNSKTWGAFNTSSIKHPLSGGVPFIGRWLDMPARPLPGDAHMPRVQGTRFGASQRMVVAPGSEENGLFHMPGGQSGHPFSPYFGAGHEAWERGEPTPFLPGPTVSSFTMEPGKQL